QESNRRRRDLADGGLAGSARQVLEGLAKVSIGVCRQNLASQCLGSVVARAEQQVHGGVRVVRRRFHGGVRAVLRRGCHGRPSSVGVLLTRELDSIRPVCVTAVPMLRTLTWPGGPASGTARTLGACTSGRCERSRRRRIAAVRPAAASSAAVSKISCA